MSIRRMIALHAGVAGDPNEELSVAARHAMFCAVLCTSCADACSAEEADMGQCIRSCLDCADICEAMGKVAVRRTGENVDVVRMMLETCASTCELCAEECERHEHEHCRLCALMCRECAADCRTALPSFQLAA
jgi:hypothetical protein